MNDSDYIDNYIDDYMIEEMYN